MTSGAVPSSVARPSDQTGAFLHLESVSKAFVAGKVRQPVLDRVSLAVAEGQFVALIGPSGCGKTTLINLVAGLIRPDAGAIRLAGQPVRAPGRDRGVVFQQHLLLPWMSAYRNVRFALDCAGAGMPASERDRLARHYLALVGLAGAEEKKPGQLSGGMQQRVGIARAFAIHPRVLLLDEPFGALDAVTRTALQDHLLQLWEAERRTVLMVTHDVDEALLLADRVVVMSCGPGAALRRDLTIPLARPRVREALLRDPAYQDLRAELLTLLTDEVAG
jgi:nitrate/nitrite transport system ATP-binding protein